jgi:N-acetylmuramic acid 6-phosphate etherase
MISDKITEQINPLTVNIDQLSITEILQLINNEDQKVANAITNEIPHINQVVESVVNSFKNGGRLIYVGSGTSGRLGVLDASECPPTFSTQPEMVQGIISGGYGALVRSVEGAEDEPENGSSEIVDYKVSSNDIVIGISTHGGAPFVLGALQKAKELGATTTLLVCNKPPELEFVDFVISVIVGPEIITGSTRMKAGSATKMVLNMITTTAMIKLNKTYGNLMVDLHASNQKLWDRGTRIVSQITNLSYKYSLDLLQKASGEVKTAIVMNKKNCNYEDAKEMLEVAHGELRKVIQ